MTAGSVLAKRQPFAEIDDARQVHRKSASPGASPAWKNSFTARDFGAVGTAHDQIRLYPAVDSLPSVSYRLHTFELRQTELFASWLSCISDPRAAQRIAQRIVRLQWGCLAM